MDAPSPGLTTLLGRVDRVTYRDAESGYSVIQLTLNDSGETVTVVGTVQSVQTGMQVEVAAREVQHPKFGKQFSIISFSHTLPSTARGITRYLSSGLIEGVGRKTAERLVSALGTEALETVRNNPERVAEIPGIGKKRAGILHRALSAQTEFQKTLRFLVELDIPPALASRVYERFKDRAIELVKNNPYILAQEVRGIGFQRADACALRMGIEPLSPQRLKAGLLYALTTASEEGHCYQKHHTLLERATTLLGIEDREALEQALFELVSTGALVLHGDGIFTPHLDGAERAVARFVAKRRLQLEHPLIQPDRVQTSIGAAEHALGVQLSPEQRIAVNSAANFQLAIITGGPGCGKTTVIKAIQLLFERAGIPWALAAPTGRAAQRMSQVCSAPASTIHRLLRYDPRQRSFIFNAQNQLPLAALIVDEASMIDLPLAKDLFAALPSSCTLILVGDKEQLPSVGPGRVFGDLVECRELRVVALSKLFRRAEESAITTVAHQVNTGTVPSIPAPDGVTKSDAYFLERQQPDEAAKLIESLVAEQIPRKFGFKGADIAVLTPSNRGPLGTHELNRRLQERLNPRAKHDERSILTVGEKEFRVGDRVCQRVNNYKIDPSGVFNGDLGTVVQIEAATHSLRVELWDGRLIEYTHSDIRQLSLAYAVTVHRSQGMEVPCVVLTLDTSHFSLLERQLVYTGITRAKRLLILVGSSRALSIATRRAQTHLRCTLLRERIEAIPLLS
jgi:exodeoxyribonuclease V alpha subunit